MLLIVLTVNEKYVIIYNLKKIIIFPTIYGKNHKSEYVFNLRTMTIYKDM